MPDWANLPATLTVDDSNGEVIISSFWKPSTEELALLNANSLIMLRVFGRDPPPVVLHIVEN